MANKRALVVSGAGLRQDTRRKERRAGGYVASVADLEVEEGALIIESPDITAARDRLDDADRRMVEAAEAWLAASADRFAAAKVLRRLLTNARRVLNRHPTRTGQLMGDPAPGRTPWS